MRKSIHYFLIYLTFYTAGAGTDPALDQRQKEIINYFKEIALGFEYGNATGITRKWQGPMKIFVGGKTSLKVLLELQQVVTELNRLATDGFSIEIVSSKAESNYFIYFGAKEEFISMYPADTETVRSSAGLFRVFWGKSNHIHRGYAFIHNQTSEKEQMHAIREELTQSLGLGKDSPLYDDSIFQSKWTLPTEYSELDQELIRYLYHPRMKVGLSGDQVELLLTEIFLAEKENL